MDSNNYVYWDPNANMGQGAFRVVVEGRPVQGDNPDGSWSNKTSAENGYNASGGPQAVARAAQGAPAAPAPAAPAPGGKSIAQMRAELVAQDGRWANASDAAVLAEYTRLSTGATGAGGPGYNIAGGYNMLDPALQAANIALGTQGQNITRYGQMGYAPIVLDPNTDYYSLVKDIPTADKNAWLAGARRTTGLPIEILDQLYDSALFSSEGMPDADTFKRHLQTWANQGLPSQAAKQWNQSMAQSKATALGYYDENGNKVPTLAREQAQWAAGQNMMNLAASLSGPENWVQYANMLSGNQNAPQLEFARRMASGQAGPAFTGWQQQKPMTLQSLLYGTSGTAGGQQQSGDTAQRATVGADAPVAAAVGPGGGNAGFREGEPSPSGPFTGTPVGGTPIGGGGNLLPTPIPGGGQVSVRKTANLDPTLVKMWNSAVKAGGVPEDWWSQHARAAPKGQIATTTRWR